MKVLVRNDIICDGIVYIILTYVYIFCHKYSYSNFIFIFDLKKINDNLLGVKICI